MDGEHSHTGLYIWDHHHGVGEVCEGNETLLFPEMEECLKKVKLFHQKNSGSKLVSTAKSRLFYATHKLNLHLLCL